MEIRKIENITALFFLISIICFPRSFLLFKLFFLTLFLVGNIITLIFKRRFVLEFGVLLFYSFVIFAGVIWSIIGLLNDAPSNGVIANFRLYVVWGFAYTIIILLLKQGNKFQVLHQAIVISGIVIFFTNFLGLCDFYFKTNLISPMILDEMDLRFGFHEGYVQMTAHNIGSLFFIVPYLLVIQWRTDGKNINSKLTQLSLVLVLLLAIFSGRRALWLCILMIPMITFFISIATGSFSLLKRWTKLLIFGLIIGCFISLLIYSQIDKLDIPTLNHLKNAFSAEDERSIQKGYLIKGFLDYPIFGSGFGLNAGYLRNLDMPWLYELTYHQLLFNFGIIGTVFMLLLFLVPLFYIFYGLRKSKSTKLMQFCIVVGFLSFLLGAYSNPYFQSFDCLIYIAMLPLLLNVKTLSIKF